MDFRQLYDNNKQSVTDALLNMWCADAVGTSQKAYVEQLKKKIGDVFAPENAIPVVQCMNSYEPVKSVDADKAKATVGNLWTKTFVPYEHQYQCWNTLLNERYNDKPMSIVVTTGTGSGKTECFMMPLVHDLLAHPAVNVIQALFLYPLNALMEDQKERLEELCKDTNLYYAVYNGDLPEREPDALDNQKDAWRVRRRIEMITGGHYDTVIEDGREKYVLNNKKFTRMLYTRLQVRQTPPNILLTNPTMLEYILLRGSDAKLIDSSKKSLRWAAIDETHTYTGAGAAELAMLLRRVLLAFGVDAKDVHFATSSATFGNGTDDELRLREFISGITGTDIEQVKAIGGERVGEKNIPEGDDHDRWKMIFKCDYVELDKLFPGNGSISEKLELLDQMCQREEDRTKKAGKTIPEMKLKVHYFYRVPNNGFYVRLTEQGNGAYTVYTENAINEEGKQKAPLLELSRCKHCGEYLAVGKVNTRDFTYKPIESDDSDMFDLMEEEKDSDEKYAIFGLSNGPMNRGDNNVSYTVDADGKLNHTNDRELSEGDWHIVANTHCCCPRCNAKLASNQRENENNDDQPEMSRSRLMRFRLPADFIARLMAPSVLDQLEKHKGEDGAVLLHDGQQYISFVDSRQSAAQATLRQNVEEERLWFYSTIYHELCRRKAAIVDVEREYKEINARMKELDDESDEYDELFQRRKKLKRQLTSGHMTWDEIADLLLNDKYCDVFAELFVKRTSDSEELDDDGNIKPSVKRQYVQSMMVMYLSGRPLSAASPETMGLFHSCYPQLAKVELPIAVEAFNNVLRGPSNHITKTDWQNLLQIYLDHTIRSNQSVYLQLKDNAPIDIFSSVRFATEKQRRRPAKPISIQRNTVSTARVVRYLCALIVRDDETMTISDAYTTYFDQIKAVVDALWADMTNEAYDLLQKGTHWDEDEHQFKQDKDNMYRLNLTHLSFKLYDDVYLCDVNTDNSTGHVECLRPIANSFKRFSPYMRGGEPVDLDEARHETWKPYPYFNGCGKTVTADDVERWAKTYRKQMCENHLWGDNGVFANRLTDIHMFPNIFVQAEHTAQVDKDVARSRQALFKSHGINILACSTTMEMGVDLGDLEVVMLTSVPPMPSNYKQRAGRSGRNNKVRSVCITLCGSDALGLRTLYHPIERIINRPMKVPTIDLMSPQVVQRHVNSYLVRAFGVFTGGTKGGSLNQKVVDYYTPFQMITDTDHHLVIVDENNNTVEPNKLMGEYTGTMYDKFNEMCVRPLSNGLKRDLANLLQGTIFDGQLSHVVQCAKESNESRYSEIYTKLLDYAYAWEHEAVGKPKFRTKLKMQYMEVMNERLLNFWATHRFTPNANMPVNVLPLDLNSNTNKSFFTQSTSSNPTYSLRDAICQYAPGNSVTIDGVVYIVRGIEFTNIYQGTRSFKTIYRNADKVVVDDPSLTNKIPWWVNRKEGLELVQPVSFVPDMNEDKSRIVEANTYTRVSAQLIGTGDWENIVTEPHLFHVRNNRDTGEAKILYYNEGKGNGYCFCPKCGRMVLEDDVADEGMPSKVPLEFNPVPGKLMENGERKPHYHYAISGKDVRSRCIGSNAAEYARRNVIIGDLLQTDYSEIRFRHKGNKKWISERSNEESLLFTLGIVFTQTLVDILGKERGAVDFAIMPNGHLCIFDTNPGGAGYSNQLTNSLLMKELIDASEKLLKEAKEKKSKDMLLDKFTLRFAKYIDINKALYWSQEER